MQQQRYPSIPPHPDLRTGELMTAHALLDREQAAHAHSKLSANDGQPVSLSRVRAGEQSRSPRAAAVDGEEVSGGQRARSGRVGGLLALPRARGGSSDEGFGFGCGGGLVAAERSRAAASVREHRVSAAAAPAVPTPRRSRRRRRRWRQWWASYQGREVHRSASQPNTSAARFRSGGSHRYLVAIDIDASL